MDINLLYPIKKDFYDNFERSKPEIYNYACLSGKQVFLRRFRSSFQVLCRQFKPTNEIFRSQDLPDLTQQYFANFPDFETAFHIFRKTVIDLFQNTYSEVLF